MSTLVRSLTLLLVLSLPLQLHAQEELPVPRRTVASAATFAGMGSGPSGSVVWGIEGTIPFSPFLAIRAEYSRWGSGIGATCLQMWPDSYDCSMKGWSGLAGIRASVPVSPRITPFVDLSGGRFTRGGGAADPHSSMALSAGAGALLRIRGGLSARVSASHLRPFDDEYETLMDTRIQYTTGAVGIEYRITR